MTRINLMPPSELSDQHLFAEFREIRRVPSCVQKALKTTSVSLLPYTLPKTYRLGTGHVKFFYNKGLFLEARFQSIIKELRHRKYKFNESHTFDPDGVFKQYPQLYKDYTPTPEALAASWERINEKLAMKPNWYRWSK